MSEASLLVHKGVDRWLFLTGGSNFVTTLYQRDAGHLPDVALTRKKLMRKNERQERK